MQKVAFLAGTLFIIFVVHSAVESSKTKSKGKVFTPGASEIDAKVESSQLILQDFSRTMLKKGKKTMEVKASSGKFLPQESITYLTNAE